MEIKGNFYNHYGKPTIVINPDTGLRTVIRKYIGKSHLSRPDGTPSKNDSETPFGELDPEYDKTKGAEFNAYLVDQKIEGDETSSILTRTYNELGEAGELVEFKSVDFENNNSAQKNITRTFVAKNPYYPNSSQIGKESFTLNGETGYLLQENKTVDSQIISIIQKVYATPTILAKSVSYQDNLKFESVTYLSPTRRTDWEVSGITFDVSRKDPNGYPTWTVVKMTNKVDGGLIHSYGTYQDFFHAGLLKWDSKFGFQQNRGNTHKAKMTINEYLTSSNIPEDINPNTIIKSWASGSYRAGSGKKIVYENISTQGCLSDGSPPEILSIGATAGAIGISKKKVTLRSNPTFSDFNGLKNAIIDSVVQPYFTDPDNGRQYFKRTTIRIISVALGKSRFSSGGYSTPPPFDGKSRLECALEYWAYAKSGGVDKNTYKKLYQCAWGNR